VPTADELAAVKAAAEPAAMLTAAERARVEVDVAAAHSAAEKVEAALAEVLQRDEIQAQKVGAAMSCAGVLCA
jgi:hypothetical protein